MTGRQSAYGCYVVATQIFTGIRLQSKPDYSTLSVTNFKHLLPRCFGENCLCTSEVIIERQCSLRCYCQRQNLSTTFRLQQYEDAPLR